MKSVLSKNINIIQNKLYVVIWHTKNEKLSHIPGNTDEKMI